MGSKKRTSKKSTSNETRIARKPPTPKAKAVKAPGIKAQIAVLLSAGGSYTVAELVKATGGKEVSVRTALSDLKSRVYCGLPAPLAIFSNDGVYRVMPPDELARLGEAIAAKEPK